MAESFGSLLQRWRREQNLSVRTLAARAGIGRSTLSRWENDRAQPGMLELDAVLNALGASSARQAEALRRLHTPRAALRLHEVTDGGEPVAGDLLRAMRMRQGWIQADIARSIGVTQGTVAKWENGEDWPSVTHLHDLCYALHASEAELTTLIAGRFTLPEEAGGDDSPEALNHQIVSLSCNHDAKGADALADLRFLSLRSALARRTPEDEQARQAMALLFSRQGQYLVERARFNEMPTLFRLQDALGNGALTENSRAVRVLAMASALANDARYANPLQAARLLMTEIKAIRDPEMLAWFQGSAGLYLAMAGEGEAGLRLNVQACETAKQSPHPDEARYRQSEVGQTLMRMGRYAEAIATFERLHVSGSLRPLTDARNALSACESGLRLCQMAESEHWLSLANRLIEAHALSSLKHHAQQLQWEYCLRAQSS